jgi:hypothetical protein
MNPLAIGLLLAATIQSHRITLDDPALAATYERLCAAPQRAAECPWLQRELEVRLLGNLQALQSLDQPIDRDVVRVAVRGEFPFLALFGLLQMNTIDSPEDEAAVTWAMDHPSPGVRRAARQMARQAQSGHPRLAALLQWGSDSGANPFGLDPAESEDWSIFMPEEPATLKAFGLPEVAALYRPSMSTDSMPVFTTTDRPEKVLAVLAKGRQTQGAMEMQEQAMQTIDSSEVERIGKEMEGVTDQAKMMELMTKLNEAMLRMNKPAEKLQSIRDPEGRYWELPAGSGQPKRIVGVGRDEALGVTTISVLLLQ